MPLRTGSATRPISLVLSTALAAATLTGCALLELASDCEGTDARVKKMTALDILDSRPDGASIARGFEEVDAGCWADSGDVVVYADRTYAFPGTRAEVTEHYQTAVVRDGWIPDPEALPGELCFTKEDMALSIVFLTAERLEEDGHGNRPDLTTGAGYSLSADSYVGSGAEASC
ncbi:hypothetical protein [Streptomyces lavendofoliae]|uniref:Lipoprotein n=1 Tax=Streptomyces lavendofoliae TaxID=67314 RepID=A0A918I237_9ACTN|nr:hypothetical protein [Streptomyces lavendofoliae]GGU50219.1 hypothetical protein GCM10010274_43640 [Streptomyces lavendofoliae]